MWQNKRIVHVSFSFSRKKEFCFIKKKVPHIIISLKRDLHNFTFEKKVSDKYETHCFPKSASSVRYPLHLELI